MVERQELSKDTNDLLSRIGTVVILNDGSTYKHLPFWFKDTDKENVCEVISMNSVPDELFEAIQGKFGFCNLCNKDFGNKIETEQHIDNYETFVTDHMQPVLRKHDRLFGLLEAGTISKEEMADLDRISPIVYAFVQADKSVREIIKVAEKGQKEAKTTKE